MGHCDNNSVPYHPDMEKFESMINDAINEGYIQTHNPFDNQMSSRMTTAIEGAGEELKKMEE